MIRKLKIFSMATAATLALVAVSASAVSAAEFHTGIVYPISGSQTAAENDVTTFTAGTVKCATIVYTGELKTETSSTLTLAPSFSDCTAFTFVKTSIDTNGCEYVFHAGGEGSMDIVCPAGKSIVVTAFNCEVTIGPQTLKSVSYANEEAEGSRDIKINMNLTGLSYTQHSKSFPGCAANGTNPFSNGTTKGEITLNAGAPEAAGIWYE